MTSVYPYKNKFQKIGGTPVKYSLRNGGNILYYIRCFLRKEIKIISSLEASR